MAEIESMRGELLKLGRSCDSGLTAVKLWVPHYFQLIEIFPKMAKVSAQIRTETMILTFLLVRIPNW